MDEKKAANTKIKTNSIKTFLRVRVRNGSGNCIFNGHAAQKHKARQNVLVLQEKTHATRLARIIMVFIITQFQKGSTDFLISSGAITAKLRYATPAENKFTKF